MATQKTEVIEFFYAPIKRWLEIHAHPTPEVLSLYISDITERKQQDAALRELTLKIRDQARIFDTTLSHITDFAYTFDHDGRFIYVNKPLLDLWGLTLREAAGKNFHELNYPPELAARLQGQIQEVIDTGKDGAGTRRATPLPTGKRDITNIFSARCLTWREMWRWWRDPRV